MRGKNNTVPNNVGDSQGSEEICELFADKYDKLYNSVPYNDTDMRDLQSDVNKLIHTKCLDRCAKSCGHIHKVSTGDVIEAVMHLKSGKRDGNLALTSDYFIQGTDCLIEHISTLLSSMVTHGFSPDGFSLSSIVSIPKNKRKSLSDPENYRGIALGSVLNKILDWVLLTKCNKALTTSDLQFGFKASHSTVLCNNVVRETLHYYANHGSDVYSVLLDASKAFDRVEYVKLFRLLIKKGMCPIIVRFLINLYTKQSVRILWEGHTSRTFNVKNGVKQGGVLSPVLFSIYMDELLLCLQKSCVGCHIGQTFVGALAYADDVIILAPSKHALNRMLNICCEFALTFDVKFNPMKSQFMYFPNEKMNTLNTQVMMNGEIIEYVKEANHLGIPLGVNSERTAITHSIDDMKRRFNVLMAEFGKAPSCVINHLYNSFCLSLYGSQVWDFSLPEVEKVYTAWRVCMRRVWKLPQRTHSNLLSSISSGMYIEQQLHSRFIRSFHGTLKSKNNCIRICAKLAISGSGSSICSSLNLIAYMYGFCKYDLYHTTIGQVLSRIRQFSDDNASPISGAIRDFIMWRDSPTLEYRTKADLIDIINEMCII